MLHDELYLSRQFEITELMDQPCSDNEIHGCLRDLASVNFCTFAYRPTLRWLDSLVARRASTSLRILDVGCGYGDMLRKIFHWSKRRGVSVKLTGLDINPQATITAREATPSEQQITYLTGDPFSYNIKADVVISSLFTHHLSNEEVIRFLCWMEGHATEGWFINDLHRHPIPFHIFRIWAKIAAWHPFVQHDGPISVLRSFTFVDWQRLCHAAGLGADKVDLQWHMPCRLCVGRFK